MYFSESRAVISTEAPSVVFARSLFSLEPVRARADSGLKACVGGTGIHQIRARHKVKRGGTSARRLHGERVVCGLTVYLPSPRP